MKDLLQDVGLLFWLVQIPTAANTYYICPEPVHQASCELSSEARLPYACITGYVVTPLIGGKRRARSSVL